MRGKPHIMRYPGWYHRGWCVLAPPDRPGNGVCVGFGLTFGEACALARDLRQTKEQAS